MKPITTAAGVVFLAKDTGRCMLQLREGTKRFNHTWGFWGGIIEKNETPYECITRELKEEIGFVPELQKLNPIDVYQSKDKNFYYYSFVYVVDNEFQPPKDSGAMFISATKIRESIKSGDNSWKTMVDLSLHQDIESYLS